MSEVLKVYICYSLYDLSVCLCVTDGILSLVINGRYIAVQAITSSVVPDVVFDLYDQSNINKPAVYVGGTHNSISFDCLVSEQHHHITSHRY